MEVRIFRRGKQSTGPLRTLLFSSQNNGKGSQTKRAYFEHMRAIMAHVVVENSSRASAVVAPVLTQTCSDELDRI